MEMMGEGPDLSSFEVYACGNLLMVEAARTAFVKQASPSLGSFFSDAFVFAKGATDA